MSTFEQKMVIMDPVCSPEEPADFTKMLEDFYQKHQSVALIVDDKGWGRAEGMIREINISGGVQPSIMLENEQQILIERIVAVNGIFKQGNTC